MQTAAPSPAKWKPQFAARWAALKGSLNEVRKACARGDKHPAWLLTFNRQGRRHCLQAPRELVPAFRQAIKNGQRLDAVLYQTGPALLKQHRQKRKKAPGNPANANLKF